MGPQGFFFICLNTYKNNIYEKDHEFIKEMAKQPKNINQTNDIICEEFFIKDGLSDETIKAIQKDILYSLKNDLGLQQANFLIATKMD